MKNNNENIELPKNNYFKAMFLVASWPWVVIIFVWLFCFFSIVLSWEEISSGAVLVGGALVAEVLYHNQRWTKLNTDPSGGFKLIPDSSTSAPIISGQYAMAPAGSGKLSIVLSLAKNYEVKSNESETYWYYKDTVERIEKIIVGVIVTTAVLGTILWGYGHIYFK